MVSYTQFSQSQIPVPAPVRLTIQGMQVWDIKLVQVIGPGANDVAPHIGRQQADLVE